MKRRSKFSLSHYKIGSFSMGELIPIGLYEVLPGDTVQQATSLFLRCAPLVSPVLHPVHIRIHHFYVPYRLLWDNFENFITGGPDGLDVSEFPTVLIPEGGFTVGSLADYFGLPLGAAGGAGVSALPFRAYNLIWNEYFRAQDLQDPIAISTDDGVDTTTVTALQRAGWSQDYFTTAAPWPQKGPAVSVPVNTAAAGQPSFSATTTITGNGVPTFASTEGVSSGALSVAEYSGGAASYYASNTSPQQFPLAWQNPNLTANTTINYVPGVSGIGSVDINQLREAFALQRFEEHRAMYGSRYTEYLRYLGVRASDARLQRPEYLGGGRQTIQFSEVLQTAEGTDPVGTMRGHGVGAMRSNRYRRFIEEHGVIISLLHVRPIAVYMQGINRMWLKRVKEDFWQRELQHIGQQPVYNLELYANSGWSGDNGLVTFGYQNRYDEYRSIPSTVSGEMRTTLNYWHLAREFANAPSLNGDFISALPSNRIFASQDSDQLYFMASHSIQARRLMSKHGNPI